MKSPLLLCSAVSILSLSACATAPSGQSTALRHGKLVPTGNAPKPAPAAPAAVATSAPVAPAEPVVVTSAPLTAPEPAAPAPVAPAPIPEPAPAAVAVVTEPPVAAQLPAPVVTTPSFQAVRQGTLVNLSWTLPESTSGYRAVEIMRNNQAQASGRSRIRAVRATVTSIEDTLPDAGAEYWYWIKLTHADGTVQNLGPFATQAKS